MKNKLFEDEKLASLETYCILKGYRGSIAHNTYDEKTTSDDKDIMGIFIPPPDVIYGINKIGTVDRMWEEKISQKKTIVWDVVYYSLPKYIQLLLKQNPNVIMLLWLAEKHYLKRTYIGEMLVRHKYEFLSKKCYQSFSGYAHGQLHRMTHYVPPGKLTVGTIEMGAKRSALVKRFGYDVKNASHLIRLLKMGLETLTTGEVLVERPDNNMLLEIKRGEWKLEKVLKYADQLFQLLDEAFVQSELRDNVDRDFANNLCMKMIKEFYEKAG